METKKKLTDDITEVVRDFESCLPSITDYEEQLNKFMTDSKTKISDSNKDKIRGLVMDIVNQAISQSNTINCLLGSLIEQRELRQLYVSRREETRQVAKKSVQRKIYSFKKRAETVVVLNYPNIETDSETTKESVKKNVNPVNLHMGVKKVKKINKGGILMELGNERDFEKLEVEIAAETN